MKIPNICAIYANLIMQKLKTLEDVPASIRKETSVVLCSKYIYQTKDITFAAACGEEPDASTYKTHPYTGFCKGNDELKNAVAEFVVSKGYGSLVSK